VKKITTILNVYRRVKNLKDQIQAIRDQTEESEIWLWVNGHPDNLGVDLAPYGADCVISSTTNFKFHGRFTCGLLARSDYLAYFDDDTIPGKLWYKNCLDSIKYLKELGHETAVLGSAGVVLHNENYVYHTRVGWPSKNSAITLVDLVGHAWFFEKRILKYLWAEEPISLDNGEDIQLSYLVQKYAKGITVCPPHPVSNRDMWGSLRAEELGIDEVATSNNKHISHAQFFGERDEIIRKAIMNGWEPCFKHRK